MLTSSLWIQLLSFPKRNKVSMACTLVATFCSLINQSKHDSIMYSLYLGSNAFFKGLGSFELWARAINAQIFDILRMAESKWTLWRFWVNFSKHGIIAYIYFMQTNSKTQAARQDILSSTRNMMSIRRGKRVKSFKIISLCFKRLSRDAFTLCNSLYSSSIPMH